ncbi:SCO family protein [Deinococcus yavapaiensis]|uniref:Protein SCO1/2 n=1 Tax=Deinococcus yavapaiensis KR-236 TaxID=694435 RepID=A0A318S336_9DEIO|nr:SCO family protein [Deinococcus yavapaiensis]PYE52911.1 protein SCO1/2 [Deinococcus yavapaiensis KR-236]
MPRVVTAFLLVVALVLGGVLAFRAFAKPLGGTTVDARPLVPVEQLVADDGKPARLSDSNGQTRLVFFGFTRCPDVCPTTMGVLARAYEALNEQQRQQLKVVLITVDPQFDTPPQLRSYLDKFDKDFVGLTGAPSALEATRKGFYIYSVPSGPGAFTHGDAVAVLDRTGRMRRVYSQDEVSGGVLTADLPRLASGRY